MRTLLLFALMISLALPCSARALKVEDLERGLILAMRPKRATTERIGSSGEAIRRYIAEGIVHRKPDRRMDYVDYRIVLKPASLLGQQLVEIEEEYLTHYLGCCVAPGIGAIVRVVSDPKPFADFAKANACTLVEEKDVQETLRDLGIYRAGERYLGISCRDRDFP